jgi:hypothetical protein
LIMNHLILDLLDLPPVWPGQQCDHSDQSSDWNWRSVSLSRHYKSPP